MSSFGARRRPSASPQHVCVIGAGPRGLSVVERLCANAAHDGRDLVVHLVDPFVGRGGRVWSTGQSPSLLMNTIASQVSMFTDDSVGCAGPIVPGPSLYEWASMLPLMEPFDAYPARVRAEARTLAPDSYPSRAFYGHYLNWVLRRLCRTAPPTVTIRLHEQSAVAVDDTHDGDQVVTLADGHTVTGLSAVVLAQGHIDMPQDETQRRLGNVAADRGLGYQPSANPAEVDLSAITAGETVAIRGMGLNFFDYLALLTTDRGGRFQRTLDGRLVYRPSGREPEIYAGSRRGVPYHARGENEKGAFGRHEPLFLTETVIAHLRARAARGDAVTFRDDVWPLIAREVEYVYYTTLLRGRRGTTGRVVEDFGARYRVTDPANVPALVDRFGIDSEDLWDWDLIARPHADRRFRSPRDFHTWLRDLLQRDLERARVGNVSDPVKAALDVLRDLRNEIRLVVDHSGLTGSSYREDLLAWYTPLNAYLSIGPPASRVEEMIALIDADVLHVLGPGMRVDTDEQGFLIRSSAVDGSEVRASTLIEARLPEVDIRSSTDPLMTYLRATGACQAYRIPDPLGDHQTGGLAVTPRPYHVIDAHGRPHPRRFGYGVPTESVHWVTAAGIRPGVDSVILGDADAIARAVLAPTPIARTATTQVARQA